LSASAGFATKLVVAGLHLEELAASPVITDLQSVRIEVFVEVIGEITVERFEHT